jgi:hypothetical protein
MWLSVRARRWLLVDVMAQVSDVDLAVAVARCSVAWRAGVRMYMDLDLHGQQFEVCRMLCLLGRRLPAALRGEGREQKKSPGQHAFLSRVRQGRRQGMGLGGLPRVGAHADALHQRARTSSTSRALRGIAITHDDRWPLRIAHRIRQDRRAGS